MENNEIRKTIKNLRNSLPKESVKLLSDKIIDKVISLDFSLYKNFFIYNSFNGEVETSRLIEYLLTQNKVISYPVIDGDNMVAGIPNSSDITISKFKTKEPKDYTIMKSVEVCFVPLLAFDKNKNRLGYGKGYYDKFLSSNPCLKIGLAYDFQLSEDIVSQPWDIPLDIIITESKIIK